jgi:hypothetical protein
MAVRNFTILKVIALLIFAFELLAPVVLTSHDPSREESKLILTNSHSNVSLFASLLCEEASEEGREGKEHKVFAIFTEVNFISVFQCLIRQNNLSQPQAYFSKIHSGTSLLSFISTYRI